MYADILFLCLSVNYVDTVDATDILACKYLKIIFK